MRKSLYLKDDDYRLSFLYGNFTTLTRFTEADLERVVSERLGPLYVSIHATDPDVRTRLLRNRRGATSLRWLELILDAGIEVHGQVVVCPGINDGAVLDDTLLGVLDRFPALTTIGVVPLGVSAHNREDEMRVHTLAEAQAVVDIVERWQARYAAALGRRLVYVSDEYYLLAQRPFPPLAAYDECSQHENGIGMARTFEAEVRAALGGAEVVGTGPRSGFFAWVDGAPADGYRAPARSSRRARGAARIRRRLRAVERDRDGGVGRGGARAVAAPSCPAGCGCCPSRTAFFGGNIGVTGLLTGEDIAAALRGSARARPVPPARRRAVARPVPRRHDRGRAAAHRSRSCATDGGSLVQALRRSAPIALVAS